ncbi:MAG: hypothetical protein M1817_003641 [Caeruleum heppii]|nr:MAG: hypothetical protein M1817_003641 [Caeruleum heppii]
MTEVIATIPDLTNALLLSLARMQEPNGHGYRNGSSGDSRRAPSGEEMMSRNGNSTTAPPSMSAHNRPGSVSVLSAPTQPRGGPGPPPRRDNPYPTPPSSGFRRGPAPHHPPPIHPRGSQAGPPSGTPSLDSPGPSSGGIPTGPRSSHAPSGHHHHHPHHPSSHGPAAAGAFRGSHNSSSRTYPLTQRFAHHLRDLPSVIPGGKLLPSGVPANVAEKLAKLEQDKKRLEQELMEKEEKLRGGLRTWERLERESARDGLRSELAEGQVGILSGESGMGGAAF